MVIEQPLFRGSDGILIVLRCYGFTFSSAVYHYS